MYYIGVDLGTSSVKLVLMEESGEIKNIVSKEYPLYFPNPGWSEQKPEDWFSQFVEGIRELLEGFDTSKVDGISFGGQMHGLVLLDENDQVLRPAILWNDGRTAKECDYLNHVIGREKISFYTANMALTGFTAPKILWVKEHEPEIFKKIAKIMLPKDYLAYKISGTFCTDVSDASGMLLFDVKNRCWSEEMIEIVGIKREQLATVYESYEVVGTLTKKAADLLNLPQSVKVIAGAGDNAAGAVGTGTLKHGMCSVSLGTSGTVFIATDHFAVDDKNAMHSFDHANGKYHFLGCMLSAASANKWWMDEIIGTKDYAKEQEGIKTLGENNVFFLPYLMGERTPHNNPNARGTFIGMTMDTSRADMTQAVLEGVTFALRDALEIARGFGVTIERVRVNGGGAKSPLWCKMIANIMNVKVDKINSEEGPGFGAAILAAVGCGKFASVEEASEKLIKVVSTVEQTPELVDKYEKKYQIFRQIYPALTDVYDQMSK
ncbi:MAG: xylulokinase [Lachnospiraceae bacterium]|nr:xylulokinase [Lachnospiraceae bacterium]